MARRSTLVTPSPLFAPAEPSFERPTSGDTATLDIIVSNQSLLLLSITGIRVSAGEAEFKYDAAGSTCVGKPIEEQCTVRVSYTPRPGATHRGALRFDSNVDGPPLLLELRGYDPAAANVKKEDTQTGGGATGGGVSGEPPEAASMSVEITDPPDFDVRKVGTASPPRAVTYKNGGSTPVVIEDVILEGGGNFSRTSDKCLKQTLKAGDSCEVGVSYTPKTEGDHAGRVVFVSSVARPAGAAGPPPRFIREVKLSGKAPVPSALPSDPELCFGRWKKVEAGAPKLIRDRRTFVLTKQGEVALSVSHVGLQGTNKDDFSIEENTCLGREITDSCKITVGFSPTEAKVRRATLVIEHDGKSVYPNRIELSGVGKPRNWFLRIFDRLFANKKQTCGSECDK